MKHTMSLNYPDQGMIWIITRGQGIRYVSSKKLGVISPKLRDLYTTVVESIGSARNQYESPEVSPSHGESVSSHMEGSKQGGVEEKQR